MLPLNERLGDFEIIRLLGKGGMGEVYEARQSKPDRLVAVKVLAPWLARDDDSLKRFWKEAEVPANLDHPGIVRIITMGKSPEGVAYFAMHLVRGISLSEMIRRANAAAPVSDAPTRTVDSANTPSAAAPASQDNMTPPSPMISADSIPPLLQDYRTDRFTAVARIGAQAAHALAYAHEKGVLHRDIKPSNLMVDQHNQVYLVDFGLTRGLEPAADGTQPGTLLGTPWYMSPEQADSKPVDIRSDIYSLGATLYELATKGLGPFTAARDDRAAVLAQVRAGQALPLRTLAPGIPPALEQIILRAMEHKPKRRYASVAEMAHDLEAFLGHATKPSSRPAYRSIAFEPRRRWQVLVGGLFLAALVIALAALAIVRPWHEKASLELDVLDGSKALPESLAKHPVDTVFSLLKTDMEPLWQKPVFGAGELAPWAPPQRLDLVSVDPDAPTLRLLGNAHRRHFDFAIDVDALVHRPDTKVKCIGGVIFGWQRPHRATDGPRKCFAIHVDNRPSIGAPHGAAVIGVFDVTPASEGRKGSIRPFVPLPEAKARIPFAQPAPAWRSLKVQVRDQAVRIETEGNSQEFELPWLRQAERFLAENLAPHGGVGIWAQDGNVTFRNASITIRNP